MKRFFVFTLIALFATTGLLLTNLSAYDDNGDYGYAGMPFENVYGYAWVTVWYDTEFSIPKSYHHFFLRNGGGVPVACYNNFEADVDGPSVVLPQSKGDFRWVPINDEASDTHTFSFDMTGKLRGKYTIKGKTDIDIEADFNNDGETESTWPWRASASTKFVW